MRWIVLAMLALFLFLPPGIDNTYAQTGETVPHLTPQQRREYNKQQRKAKREQGMSQQQRANKSKNRKAQRLKNRLEKNAEKQEDVRQQIVREKQQQRRAVHNMQEESSKEVRLKNKQFRLRDKRSKLQLKYSTTIQSSGTERRMRSHHRDNRQRDRQHCFERFKKRLKGEHKR